MDKTCINNNILNIQCKHGVLGSTLNAHLSGGTRKIACLNRYNVATGYLLNILRGYTPFQNTVTYAYKFTFNKSDTSTARVDMIFDVNVLIYNGTGSGEDIAIYFEAAVKAGSFTNDYYIERVDNVLYLYSYDSSASFGDSGILTTTSSKVTVSTVNLENDLGQILNIWNNLTEQELCNLITFATKTASTGEDLPTGSSGGCNC